MNASLNKFTAFEVVNMAWTRSFIWTRKVYSKSIRNASEHHKIILLSTSYATATDWKTRNQLLCEDLRFIEKNEREVER